MAEMGHFGSHTFLVSASKIEGFTDLKVKGGIETEDVVSGSEQFVRKKNSTPLAVTLKVILDARLGVDARGRAMDLVRCAHEGHCNYLYIGGKKLVDCILMWTEAALSEVKIAPDGTWIRAEVDMTFEQCSTMSSSTSGTASGTNTAASGSAKASVTTAKPAATAAAKTTTTTSKTTTTTAKTTATTTKTTTAAKTAVSTAATTVKKTVTTAAATVNKLVSAAKAASTAKKTTTTANKAKVLVKTGKVVK